MGTRAILISCLCLARLAQAAGVAGQPGAFARAGVGARAAALGNAFGALAEGASATYWQPAALAEQKGASLSSMVASLSLGRSFNYVGAAWGPRTASRWGGVGMGWVNFSLGDDFEGRATDSAGYYSFSDQQSLYLLSWGLPLTRWMAFGATGRLYQRQLERFSAFGSGTDLGLLLRPWRGIRLSVHASDLGSQLTWSTGYDERFPWTLRASLATALWSEKLKLLGQLSQTQARDPEGMAGIELWPIHLLALRVGVDRQGFSLGGGAALALATFGLRLDYSLAEDPLKQGNVQKISLEMSF